MRRDLAMRAALVVLGLLAARSAAAFECDAALYDCSVLNGIDCSVYDCQSILDVTANGAGVGAAESRIGGPGGQDRFFTPRWLNWTDFVWDMRNRFGVNPEYGFTPWTPGDYGTKVNNTFNTLAVLAFGTTDTPSFPAPYFDADTAYCWAGDQIRVLIPANSTPSGRTDAFAATHSYWWYYYHFHDVYLLPGFFTQNSAIARAGILVHEARHAEGCTHNVGDYDQSFENGCQEYSGNGAFAFEIYYLADYARRSAGRADWSTPSIRKAAADEANLSMRGLITTPCWMVGDDGNFYLSDDPRQLQSCGWYN